MSNRFLYIILIITAFLSACSSTKYVEEGDYLLNKTSIKVENGEVPVDQLDDYIYQKPNKDVLFIPKMGLHIYSLSGRDTTKKINRLLRRMGSAPVIYDENLTLNTEKQLTKKMKNLGYLNAEVTHCADTSSKKLNITYCIRPKELYTVNSLDTKVETSDMRTLLKTRSAKKILKIKENQPFDAETFNNMSVDLTNLFWNMGYYYLTKDNFYFLADTSIGNHKVDLTLAYRKIAKDSLDEDLSLRRYTFRNVTISNEYGRDLPRLKRKKSKGHRLSDRLKDTVMYKGVTIINGEEGLIRPSVLFNNNFIRPGRFYSDRLVDNTYNSINALSAVSQVGIQLDPVDSAQIDAKVTLTPANLYYFQFGIDGTNTAGDLGVSSTVSFQQRNLFKGSEVLSIKLNGAFEHIRSRSESVDADDYIATDNYYEYGGEVALTIPRIMLALLPERYRKQVGASTTFSLGANWMKRPEYDRRFLSADWKYNWYTKRKRIHHTFNLCNINYVVSPRTSKWFQNYLERSGNELLKESYKDQFITRCSYSVVYGSDLSSDIHKKGWTIRSEISVAGTVPYLVCKIAHTEKENGIYNIIGTPFAQYSKATFDVTKTFYVKDKTQLVTHVGLGVAIPYGNSDIMPYEQRFFAGGANTVRGWDTRSLGPGIFNYRNGGNFITQTGDVKMILNFEYRQQTNTFIDLAAFVDAGNVWTIKEYEKQQGGMFYLNEFYKQLGLSWGIGIRPNFKFIIIRLDAGMQIYDPSYAMDERWVITKPSWDRCSLHFAVGYPF